MKKRHINIPVFIPELACPNRCVFCNQHRISGQLSVPAQSEVRETIETYLSTSSADATVHIAFFGGNFTGIPMAQQEAYLNLATEYIDNNQVHGIRLSTRPDYITPEVVQLLKRYKIAEVELGMQSADADVLMQSGRGHTLADVTCAVSLLREAGLTYGLQMMLGLPGDTKAKALKTALEIVALGAVSTRIYPCLVIADTELAHLYREKRYQPLSLEEAVDWGKDILRLFMESGVRVLRVGLHASSDLREGRSVVAGPFHPAMKEMMLSAIWWDLLEPLTRNAQSKSLRIAVPTQQLNYAVGYKGENRRRLLEVFPGLKIVGESGLTDFDFKLTR